MKKPSSESDAARSPSGQYDTVSKRVIQQNPEDWIRFTLGIPEAKVIEILDTEQLTVRAHRADSFIHANILGKEAIVHFEFQTRDSTRTPMPYRVVGYAGRGIETFQKPIYSHVIYLHPDAGRGDPGQYVQDMPGYEITIKGIVGFGIPLTAAREKYDDFREVPQDFQNHALRRNDKAFANFRRRCKNGDAKKGYPRHKKRVRSLTWSLRKYKVKDKPKGTYKRKRENPIIETDFRHNRLKVPKLGEVKIYMHRRLQGDPKEVTLVKKASGWYAHISCDIPDPPKVEPMAAIGIDVGTTHYLTTSEGEKIDNPRWYRKAEGLLHKHNQTMARRKKGSNRWQKAVHATALHHERTADKRKDFIGKLVYKLYHHYENNVLVAENLRVSNMVKNKHLSKSISDTSWATFFEWCGNIAERDGLHFHQVAPKNTSQNCSCCGKKSPKKLSLSVRTFNCQFCGNSMDRDHNAAKNILFRAAAALRGERWVTTLSETRNKNEARDLDLQNATQRTLFDAIASPSL